MQILQMPDGRKLDVDRAFMDGGAPASYQRIGGQHVMIEAGRPPRPQVFMRGSAFFYADGKPVNRPEDVEWLPDKAKVGGRIVNFKAMAQRFVAQQPPPAPAEDDAEGDAEGEVVLSADATDESDRQPEISTPRSRPAPRRHRGRPHKATAKGGVVVSRSDNPNEIRPQPKPGKQTVAFKPEDALGHEALAATRA